MISSLVGLIASFQYGINIGVVNAPSFSNGNDDDDNCSGDDRSECVIFHGHTSFEWTLVVSIWILGGAFGAMMGGGLADKFGRKKTMLGVSALTAVGGLVQAISPDIYWLMVGRLVVGLACGTGTMVISCYLGELPPPSLRGALGTCNQFGTVCGILFANCLVFALGDRSGWRYLFGFTIVPAMFQLLCGPFIVESPRWLAMQGDMEGAADALRRLRDRDDVLRELDNIVAASRREASGGKMTMKELFAPELRRPLTVTLVLQMAQQLCGVNAVFFYSASFFNMSDSRVGTALVGAVNVLSTGAAIFLMDRMGRRKLLLISEIGAGLSMVALFFTKYYDSSVGSVVAVMLFVSFFELGLGPIPWLITAEIFPARSRATAVSVATAVNWACNLVVGLGYPYLSKAIGGAESFIPFAGVCVAAFIFTRVSVPETRNKTLEEIQSELGMSTGAPITTGGEAKQRDSAVN